MEKEVPGTIDEYIAGFPPPVREKMLLMRQIVHDVVPDIAEKISWGMATFYKGKKSVHFAGQKNHLGFYPAPETIEAFKEELSPYVTTKGGVQLPYSGHIPSDLIARMVKFVFRE